MYIEHDLPAPVREIEHIEIPMPDGTRLAARIWMPENAEQEPVPAILEYIPYRKNDKTLERDHARAPWLAARGYAYVRLDIRGTGESEGVMTDEYTETELRDGCDAIAWIADQAWCDGGVGIVGISWGGFNGLQIAALQPPALKAVVTICSTDDRYADDVHYMGGTLLIDQLSWASVMFGINTLPPDPKHVGDRWRDMWLDRLKHSGLWMKTWMEHQTRDDFWKHGSICEDYSDVQVPVYAVSGWADGYCRTVFRLVENLTSPVKGIVGPWSHKYPHLGEPGPAIDWLGEELRWWDQWLKEEDTGIMEEPPLRLYMQDHAGPQAHYEYREGRWVTEPAWPSPNVSRREYALGSDGKLDTGGLLPHEPMKIKSPLSVGLAAGKWCSYANPGDQPSDQRDDDAGSLVFETAPLSEALEIAGDTRLRLSVSVDKPVAQIAARLVDVAPGGASTRVSYGVLNLTHRDSHETPEELVPGEVYEVEVPFKHVAQTFRPGHRIRLSVSSGYFPLIWPAPEEATLTLHPGDCALLLPVRSGPDGHAPEFDLPRSAPPLELEVETPPDYGWKVTEDRATGHVTVDIFESEGAAEISRQSFWHAAHATEHYSFDPGDVRSVEGRAGWTHEMRREGWRVRTETQTRLTSTAEDFVIEATLKAYEGEHDSLVHTEVWHEVIPRNLV